MRPIVKVGPVLAGYVVALLIACAAGLIYRRGGLRMGGSTQTKEPCDMYAVIADGGKQYLVRPGQKLFVEKRVLPEGAATVEFSQVMLVGEGETTRVGTPWVAGASVTSKLVGTVKGPKETIVKFRRRKGYRLKKGHRQQYLQVTVESING